MTDAAGDRPGLTALRAVDDRPAPPLPSGVEIAIGAEAVLLLVDQLELSVDPGLGVRVRIYGADRKTIRADIAVTAVKALQISRLFQRAAERADPALMTGPVA